jgi:hypothetical protein
MKNGVASGATLNTQARKQVCSECVYISAETYDLPVEWLDDDHTPGGGSYRYFKTAINKAILNGCGQQNFSESAIVCDGYAGDYYCDCGCN